MPRGPGKKENYNFDYSRFNDAASQAKNEEEDQGMMGLPPDMIRQLPGELQEAFRMMQISRQTGDSKAQERANELALKAVERGGPEMKQRFEEELRRSAQENPEARPGIEAVLGKSSLRADDPSLSPAQRLAATGDRMGDLTSSISQMQKSMQESADKAAKQLEAMNRQQQALESIRGPEDFAKFMAEQGLSQQDLQSALGGNEEQMRKLVEKSLGQILEPEHEKEAKQMDEVLNAVDDIHRKLHDQPDRVKPEKPRAPAEPEPVKKKREAEVKEPEPKIPEHRVQYQKDEVGRLQSVELRCELPGVAAMGDIEVDVAEKHLRVRTLAPAYVVNVGPFPNLVDASAARAKFSKKKQELTLTVPAML